MTEKLRVNPINEIVAGISVLMDTDEFGARATGLLGKTFDLKSAYKQFGVDAAHAERLRIAVKRPGGEIGHF